MKRIIITLALAFLTVCTLSGQGQIHTKKFRLSDFSMKTTKVVLGASPVTDEAVRKAVAARWRLSPYEFCSVDEYGKIKESPQYYFLICSEEKSGKENAPDFLILSVIKGGKQGTEDPTKESMEVVSVPIAPGGQSDGRECGFIPAFIDIVQVYIEKAMLSDKVAMGGITAVSTDLGRSKGMKAYVFEDDIAPSVGKEKMEKLCSDNMFFVDIHTADDIFSGDEDALVSYVVAPASPRKGAHYYKMLFGTQNHELYYFSRAAFKDEAGMGFTEAELRKIARSRR